MFGSKNRAERRKRGREYADRYRRHSRAYDAYVKDQGIGHDHHLAIDARKQLGLHQDIKKHVKTHNDIEFFMPEKTKKASFQAGVVAGMEKAAAIPNWIRSKWNPQQIKGIGDKLDIYELLQRGADLEKRNLHGGGATMGMSNIRMLKDVDNAIKSGNTEGARRMLAWWETQSVGAKTVSLGGLSSQVSPGAGGVLRRMVGRTGSGYSQETVPEHLKNKLTGGSNPVVEPGRVFSGVTGKENPVSPIGVYRRAGRKVPPVSTVTTAGPDTTGAMGRVVDYGRRNPGMTAAAVVGGLALAGGLAYAAKKGLERQYGSQYYGKYDKSDEQQKAAFYEGGRVGNASLGRMALKCKKDKVQPPPEKKPSNEVSGEEQNERK